MRLAAGAFQDVLDLGGTGRIETRADDRQSLGGERVLFAICHRVIRSG
jgi:hypothetical protein